jgi:DNA-3-methyladenine glycosylase II
VRDPLGALVAPPFDLAAAVVALERADPRLAELMARVGPCRLAMRPLSPFHILLRSIVYQQLAGKAAAAIFGRVCAAFSSARLPRPGDVVAAPMEVLRGAGLSQGKALAVKDLAEKTLAGLVPQRSRLARLDDEAIVERLVAVRGVGRWTVEMLLIFGLGRPDVLPLDDYGVRKGFQSTFGKRSLPTPRQLARHGERWRPYRSVASWYLWRAAEAAGPLRQSRPRKARQAAVTRPGRRRGARPNRPGGKRRGR